MGVLYRKKQAFSFTLELKLILAQKNRHSPLSILGNLEGDWRQGENLRQVVNLNRLVLLHHQPADSVFVLIVRYQYPIEDHFEILPCFLQSSLALHLLQFQLQSEGERLNQWSLSLVYLINVHIGKIGVFFQSCKGEFFSGAAP